MAEEEAPVAASGSTTASGGSRPFRMAMVQGKWCGGGSVAQGGGADGSRTSAMR
ncbi:methionine synthase [Sesbania bispinosa]|nr:methionine synthase [Sesbania bispinosa]